MVLLGSFKNNGHIVKTGILHKAAEVINTTQPLSDTVNDRSTRLPNGFLSHSSEWHNKSFSPWPH